MTRILQIILSLLALQAFAAHADWEQETQPTTPAVSEAATELAATISELPDPLFISESDRRRVDRLLAGTLRQIDRDIQSFKSALSRYHTNSDKANWLEVQNQQLTLVSLSQSKQTLLKLSSTDLFNKLTGFGPRGVTQFKTELKLAQLNTEYLILLQIQSFKAFLRDLTISPVPILAAFFKLLLVYLLLNWWLKHSKNIIRQLTQSPTQGMSPPWWARLLWYIGSANRPIAWLIAITLSLRILSSLPSLQHLIFLEIIIWWILGGSIIIKFMLEFAYRNSRNTNKPITALRLSTIRYYVWSVIVTGVILQLAQRSIGQGTIYHWITNLVFFWFIFITILVIHKWKSHVFSANHEQLDTPIWITWAINNKNHLVLSTFATALMMFWLVTRSAKQYVIANLSQYAFFSQALAYLFRIEVAKQTNNHGANNNLVRIKRDEVYQYILPGREDSELIDYPATELKQLSQYLLSDNPSMCVVSGERGIGTTTLLKQLHYKVKNATAIYISCPNGGYCELIPQLATELGLDSDASEIQILSHLRKSEICYFIAIDNAQRLVKPRVGGLGDLIKFTNLMRRSKKNHRCVLAIEKSSWRFVDRARGERLLFDHVVFLPRWSEAQIAELLASRINTDIEKPVTFEGLVVPKQWDQDEITEEERARIGFFRILWHYADGNPTVALRFFRLSLRRDKTTNDVVVRLFNAPTNEDLEKMPKPMLAILRSVVQLEVSSPEELSECTQLTIAEVIGTLRYFESRGYIEWTDDKARISDHWYRYITNALHRQHLLVK
ncbi:ATP-binding protein [Shewanella sp. Isolate11]|uniref:AAA family ATPase n=1 Tax=Shewanella sp. Isolate11 TaxID=2908530 RepID=UPI001EFDAAD8|nr:ATP-binding protein [Shewanella sp. Isolate11]MCG9698201.1 ATP-binding protein [Shewanella sp. Isolate11]